ncbi:hypothetical protein [Arthrobacter sp. Z1-15]
MSNTAIILTIAACIAGLVILYFLLGGIFLLVAGKKAKKTFDDFDRGFDGDFFNRR